MVAWGSRTKSAMTAPTWKSGACSNDWFLGARLPRLKKRTRVYTKGILHREDLRQVPHARHGQYLVLGAPAGKPASSLEGARTIVVTASVLGERQDWTN